MHFHVGTRERWGGVGVVVGRGVTHEPCLLVASRALLLKELEAAWGLIPLHKGLQPFHPLQPILQKLAPPPQTRMADEATTRTKRVNLLLRLMNDTVMNLHVYILESSFAVAMH